jgi:hypothetical protein
MYLAEINELAEKGEIFRKYELTPEASANLISKANAVTPKDGSCEIIDTTTYPGFVSVRGKDGKWKTAVYVAINPRWKKVPEKRADYFKKTAKLMNLLESFEFTADSGIIPQVIVKK